MAKQTYRPADRVKVGGYVSHRAAERLRDMAYWRNETLGELLEEAVPLLLEHVGRELGGRVPPRPQKTNLQVGRPRGR